MLNPYSDLPFSAQEKCIVKRRFGDLEVATKFLRGTLWWTKTKPCKTGPWLPQNCTYQYPEPPYTVHTDHVDDNEMVEVEE